MASPFGTIADAVAVPAVGMIVALGTGTYDEAVLLPADTTLWGACVAGTRVASTVSTETAGTLTVGGMGVEIRNLQVGGARPGIWAEGVGRTVHIEDVLVQDATDRGMMIILGATATGRSIAVRDTHVRASDGLRGRGIQVHDGAQATLSRIVFERNREMAVAAFDPVTRIDLTDAAIRDTASTGMFGRGVDAITSSEITLTRVVVEGSVETGVVAEADGILDMTDVVVRDTLPRTDDDMAGAGLLSYGGGRATATRALFERNRLAGIYVGDGTLTATDVVVQDTLSQVADGLFGRALHCGGAGTTDVTRAVFQRNRGAGVYAGGGADVTLRDVTIRDTEGSDDGSDGEGIGSELDARVTVERAAIERNRRWGVYASGANRVTLTDVVIRDTRAQQVDGRGGRGIEIHDGGELVVTRAVLERNHDLGIFVAHAGVTATLADVVIRDTAPEESDDRGGRGLNVQDGAEVFLDRAVIEGNRELGVFVNAAVAEVTDVVVRDTASASNTGEGGVGLYAGTGGRFALTRAIVERNHGTGVYVLGTDSAATLTDVIIRDTDSQVQDGAFGRGLNVESGADVEVTRAIIERNRENGVSAGGDGAHAVLRDVVIRDTRERACAVDTCAGYGSGFGIAAFENGAIEVIGFLVEGNVLCGVQVAHGGVIDLHDGEIAENPIGANIQTEGFDVQRLLDRVVFRDNGNDLDTSAQTVPEAQPPIAPP